MNEILAACFLLSGALFLLLAAVGVLRMPDLYTRMQPATKAVTLGSALMLIGLAIFFGRLGVTTRALATIAFFLLTAPVTAHLIGRAAYVINVPRWEGTRVDELQGRYDLRGSVLHSAPRFVPLTYGSAREDQSLSEP